MGQGEKLVGGLQSGWQNDGGSMVVWLLNVCMVLLGGRGPGYRNIFYNMFFKYCPSKYLRLFVI